MLKPSYAELMEVLNRDTEETSEITSRYTIVIAASKRARQIIDGDEPMVEDKKGKPLSTAVEEIYNGKIKVVPEGQGTVLNLHPIFDDTEYFAREEEFAKTTIKENDDIDDDSEISDVEDDFLDSDEEELLNNALDGDVDDDLDYKPEDGKDEILENDEKISDEENK